jgi:hypothetical protein
MADADRKLLTNPRTSYERSDVKMAAVAVGAIAILAFLALMPLVLRFAYPGATKDIDRRLAIDPPGPRLQTDSPADLAKLRAEEAAWLDSYGWVDREHGIVHIPIREAMRQVAQHGIEGFPRPAP